MGGAVSPPCYLTWEQTMVEVMKIMVTSFKKSQQHTATLSVLNLQQATANPCPCQRLLHTPRQVWVSFLWGHCSFHLGPSMHKFPRVCMPSKSLFSQSCVSSGSSMVVLMAASSKRAYAIPRSTAPRAPAPVTVHCWPVPPQEILKHSSVSVSVGAGVHRACMSISGRYQVWF